MLRLGIDAWLQEWADSLCCGVNTASRNKHRNKHLKAYRGKIENSDSVGTDSHAWRWELDHIEGSALKNWCFQTLVLEKSLESPLDSTEIKPVNPKGNQPWIFIGRTDAEAETLVLWPSDAKSWLIGKDPDAGKDWRQEEKRTIEDVMVGWHHRFSGHEFEQTLGDGEEQRGLVCCSPWSGRVGHNLVTE